MREKGYRKNHGRGGRLLVSFLCVVGAFAVVFGAFELFGRRPDPAPAVPETLPNPLMSGILEGLPKSEYDPAAFAWRDGFLDYSGEPEARRGIDVSSHQGTIDWAAVAADGVEFAMLRVAYRGYTEGEIAPDPCFAQNVAGALENGIAVGVYFFSQAITEAEARAEAQTALDAIQGLDISYPVIFDWEDIPREARTDGMDSQTLTACARAFCETIEQAGYATGVYFNQVYGYQEYDLSQLRDYVFWLAEYQDAPSFYYRFELWQYTSAGTVSGIEGPVDLNLSFWQPGI